MTRPSITLLRSCFVVALTLCVAPALAQSRRPRPREAIERNLALFTTAERELSLTEPERQRVEDLHARAETWAAEMVEAEHRHHQPAVRDRAHRIERLAAVLRARVEALRAEAMAAEAERAAVAAVERRTERRAVLERAAEQRLALQRSREGVSTWTLPTPDADAAAPHADAAAEAAR